MPKPADLPRAVACLAGAIDAANDGRSVGLLLIRSANHRAVALNRGILAAERLLEECEKRIAGALRPRDALLRIGDADYAIVVHGLAHAGHVTLAAQKLLRLAESPVQLDDSPIQLSLVVAAAIFPNHAADAATLFDAANQTLEQCMRTRRPFLLCERSPKADAVRAWRIEQLLGGAFERGELHLCYQPKIGIASGALEGAEALTRWHSEELGAVAPDEFIGVAEQCGRIQQLTWAALHSALEQASRWRAGAAHVPIAINVSPICLQDADFLERTQRALTIWAAPRGLLTLEITESAMLDRVGTTFDLFNKLRAQGVRISIDDFGTGYSSFSYFKMLPADELKIDKSFVSGMTASAADRHIVQTITELAHRFGMKVVAEGVEDPATLQALKRIGCDTAQGYLYSRPIPAPQFELEWLARAASGASCGAL